MASIPEKIKESKEKLQKIQEQIRELKKLRKQSSLNPIQKNILLDLDEAQKNLIKYIKKLYDSFYG